MGETTTAELRPGGLQSLARAERPALVIMWSAAAPDRVGEVATLARGVWIMGRGGPRPEDEGPRVRFVRQRPNLNEARPPLTDAVISRRQLRLELTDTLEVRNLGRCPLRVGRQHVKSASLREGDLLELEDTLLLRFTRRPEVLLTTAPAGPFGLADPLGLVGEAPAIWTLRARLAFLGRRAVHTLVLGPSGAGKELAARALHATSTRCKGPFVSRSAATIPESLADAELFGTAKDYPNSGAPARDGLIGAATGGTLFLDEIGEMPEALQAHLLRVLDQGEYHRLGEARARRADLRLVAATNRSPTTLKHDLRARMKIELEVQGLDARTDDVPLIAHHLLKKITAGDPELADRFLAGGEPRLSCALVEALCQHEYTHHVRELEALLWQAIGDAKGDTLTLSRGLRRRMSARPADAKPTEIDAETLKAALAEHGSQAAVCRALGLRNRFQLYRLVRRYGLGGGDPSP